MLDQLQQKLYDDEITEEDYTSKRRLSLQSSSVPSTSEHQSEQIQQEIDLIKAAKKARSEINQSLSKNLASLSPTNEPKLSTSSSFSREAFFSKTLNKEFPDDKKAMQLKAGIVLGVISIPLFFIMPVMAVALALVAIILIFRAIKDHAEKTNNAENSIGLATIFS